MPSVVNGKFSGEISERGLRIDAAANLPHTPFALSAEKQLYGLQWPLVVRAIPQAYTRHSESINTGQANSLVRLRSADFVYKYRDLSPVTG